LCSLSGLLSLRQDLVIALFLKRKSLGLLGLF